SFGRRSPSIGSDAWLIGLTSPQRAVDSHAGKGVMPRFAGRLVHLEQRAPYDGPELAGGAYASTPPRTLPLREPIDAVHPPEVLDSYPALLATNWAMRLSN